jgi:hypothetical protein
VIHLLLHVLGIDDETSHWYAFWSGIGADLPMLGGVALYVRHHNCHEHGCLRLGHRMPTGEVYCHRHRSS